MSVSERQATFEAPDFELKGLAVLVPMISSAIAITYDVGFFAEIDIRFFTLFSLSEHVVFALQALPVATVLALLIVSTFNLSWMRRMISLSMKPRKERGIYPYFVIPLSLLIISMGVALIGVLSAAMLLAVVAFVICLRALNAFTPVRSLMIGVVCIGVLLVAFSMGRDFARFRLWFPQQMTHVKHSEGEALGILVRSGERGILFVDQKSRQIRFLRWDTIKEISTESGTALNRPRWYEWVTWF
jgi:hypothetical protein